MQSTIKNPKTVLKINGKMITSEETVMENPKLSY